MFSLSRSHRKLAVAFASALATACGAPVASPAEIPRPVPIPHPSPIVSREIAPVTVATVSIEAATPATGPVILIDRAHDPNRIGRDATDAVDTTVQRALDRAGYATAVRGDAAIVGAFLVTPTVHSLTVAPEGSHTTISCSITLRISPWSSDEQVERWEAHSTASATGEARATTSNTRAQVELGVRDCLEGAVTAAAAREVMPFLRRMTRESKNVSDSTSRTEL